MPGKQMAIDADLNAGLINQDEAKHRRAEIAQEADFYGSMDGASKFVKGDAVAGLLILFINLIGGIGIGMLQHGLDFTNATQNYALLTIGDGLVAQIPSLLLSTSAAIMVTRVTTSQDMGGQILKQMFDAPKALGIAAAILILLGLIPGMPHVAFLGLGLLAAGAAWWVWKQGRQAVAEDGSSGWPAAARSGGGQPAPSGGARPEAADQGQGRPAPPWHKGVGRGEGGTVTIVGREGG